jgi:hypothetical protein
MEKDNLLYLIELNNNIIGAYNNLSDAETYILGCFQNNFYISAKIKIYKINSCYSIETKSYSSNNSIISDKKPIYNETILIKENSSFQDNNEPFLQMAKQKIEIQHKINILKNQKEKMEESKRVFENDLKLFNLFNESKQKDSSFEIPELFKKKYDIMIKLNIINKLNWNEFIKEFHTGENNYEDYFGLNNYESVFLEIENENNNFSEEIDIESDSSTASSDK